MPEPRENFVDGRRSPPRSGSRYEKRDPVRSGEVQDRWPDSGERDAVAAVAAAGRAFEEWRRVPPADRAEILLRTADALEADAEELCAAFSADLGIPVPADAAADHRTACRLTRFLATSALRYPEAAIEIREATVHRRRPLGVAAIAPGWSAPMPVLATQLTACLAAGGTAVVLAPPEAPRTVDRFLETFAGAGISDGVVNWIHGRTASVLAEFLAGHSDVAAAALTGGAAAPAVLLRLGERGLPCRADRAAPNGIIVLDDADLDAALEDAVRGGFGFAGQRVDSVSRIIAHRKIAPAFTRMLAEAARGLRLGGPEDADAQIGPLAAAPLRDRAEAMLGGAVEAGAHVETGGSRPGGSLAEGWFFQPTVLTGVRSTTPVMSERVTAPLVSVLTVDSYQEAVHVLNDVSHALTASIYTRDADRALRAAGEMHAAAVAVNAPASLDEGLRPARAIETFTELQTVALHRGRRSEPR